MAQRFRFINKFDKDRDFKISSNINYKKLKVTLAKADVASILPYDFWSKAIFELAFAKWYTTNKGYINCGKSEEEFSSILRHLECVMDTLGIIDYYATTTYTGRENLIIEYCEQNMNDMVLLYLIAYEVRDEQCKQCDDEWT